MLYWLFMEKGGLKQHLGMLLGDMLLCILGQLQHLRVWFLHVVAVGAIHQRRAHSEKHSLVFRLHKYTKK